MMPHTTIESYHENDVSPAYVVADIDQHGNVIRYGNVVLKFFLIFHFCSFLGIWSLVLFS